MAKSIGYHSKAIVKVMIKYSNEAERLFALLLDNISLSTALTDLALIMLVAVLLLLLAVTRDSSANGAQGTLSAVLDTLTPVLELTLSFLLLSSGVLLGTTATEALVADEVANGFLGRTDSLVPLASGAVLVVLGHGASVGVGREGT